MLKTKKNFVGTWASAQAAVGHGQNRISHDVYRMGPVAALSAIVVKSGQDDQLKIRKPNPEPA